MTHQNTQLKGVKRLIKQGWCKGRYARDSQGETIGPYDPRAVEFCLLGAIDRTAGDSATNRETINATTYRLRCAVKEAICAEQPQLRSEDARSQSPGLIIQEFNDSPSTSRSDVLRILDATIDGSEE